MRVLAPDRAMRVLAPPRRRSRTVTRPRALDARLRNCRHCLDGYGVGLESVPAVADSPSEAVRLAERTGQRLEIVLVLILSLLYLTVRSLRDAEMVFSGVLFALLGQPIARPMKGRHTQ
jgi:hypothetical protein